LILSVALHKATLTLSCTVSLIINIHNLVTILVQAIPEGSDLQIVVSGPTNLAALRTPNLTILADEHSGCGR